jgi:hypothetical protein
MHLTNYAINKLNKNFIENQNEIEEKENGHKRSLKWFFDVTITPHFSIIFVIRYI